MGACCAAASRRSARATAAVRMGYRRDAYRQGSGPAGVPKIVNEGIAFE
jgi:hypothetical protein